MERTRASAPTDWHSNDRSSWSAAAAAADKDRGASHPDLHVRLPPILPGPMDSGPVPRLTDPYPGVKWAWSAGGGGQVVEGTEVVDRKESMQLSPRSGFRQLGREGGIRPTNPNPNPNPKPNPPEADRKESMPVSPRTQALHVPPGHQAPEEPGEEADGEARQPKRPKMSVNEIVNE